jgi:hypothetical protein
LALPTIFFFEFGVFDEYDYWTGTVSLVVFALAEVFLFAWIFGMDKGWDEINYGADIKVPKVYRFIIKYITPLFILVIFLASLIQPKDNDWQTALSGKWELDRSSIIGKIINKGINHNRSYFSSVQESEVTGVVDSVENGEHFTTIHYTQTKKYYKDENGEMLELTPEVNLDPNSYEISERSSSASIDVKSSAEVVVGPEDKLEPGSVYAKGSFVNKIFFLDMSRLLLALVFLGLALMVRRAQKLRDKRA